MPPGKPRPGTMHEVVPGRGASRRVIVATGNHVYVADAASGTMTPAAGLDGRLPTALAMAPASAPAMAPGPGSARLRAWCGTDGHGVYRSDDGGETWAPAGLEDHRIMSVASGAAEPGVVWAGTEPSQLWRSADGGSSWTRSPALESLPSSSEWAFPPRPDTHHVRWIALHPHASGVLWAAIEAGALVATRDGGRSWRDRVPGGPYDTHELAIHPDAPDTLRVAAGDGYYESHDAGATWVSPMEGLDVGYFRSVAMDPGDPATVLIAGASGPRSTYVAGNADGRVYRREGDGRWRRVTAGWPDPPATTAPLLAAGVEPGELWGADERGVHRSGDGGRTWDLAAAFPDPPGAPRNLRALVVR